MLRKLRGEEVRIADAESLLPLGRSLALARNLFEPDLVSQPREQPSHRLHLLFCQTPRP